MQPVYSKRDIGRIGEDVACQFLVQKGYRIVERNFRRPYGEIDIVAERGGIIRFVEVKAVSCKKLPDMAIERNDYHPEELVHAAKMHRIARTAEVYMISKKDSRDYQIDVVAVFLLISSRRARCRLFENVI